MIPCVPIIIAKFAHAKISERRYQHKLQQEQAKFPQQTLTSGVYALIDAFPLEKNLVVEGK